MRNKLELKLLTVVMIAAWIALQAGELVAGPKRGSGSSASVSFSRQGSASSGSFSQHSSASASGTQSSRQASASTAQDSASANQQSRQASHRALRAPLRPTSRHGKVQRRARLPRIRRSVGFGVDQSAVATGDRDYQSGAATGHFEPERRHATERGVRSLRELFRRVLAAAGIRRLLRRRRQRRGFCFHRRCGRGRSGGLVDAAVDHGAGTDLDHHSGQRHAATDNHRRHSALQSERGHRQWHDLLPVWQAVLHAGLRQHGADLHAGAAGPLDRTKPFEDAA